MDLRLVFGLVAMVTLVEFASSAGQCGYTCSPNDPTLDCWRENIDYYSDIILEALNQRAIVANHIGHWKRQHGLPIVDHSRISAVLNRIADRNKGPLPRSAVLEVFGAIVNETAAYEEKFQGEPARYKCLLDTPLTKAPSTLFSTSSASNELHIMLVTVIVVQIGIAIMILVSVLCVMKKLHSIRR